MDYTGRGPEAIFRTVIAFFISDILKKAFHDVGVFPRLAFLCVVLFMFG